MEQERVETTGTLGESVNDQYDMTRDGRHA
jgi:hypothetical protein